MLAQGGSLDGQGRPAKGLEGQSQRIAAEVGIGPEELLGAGAVAQESGRETVLEKVAFLIAHRGKAERQGRRARLSGEDGPREEALSDLIPRGRIPGVLLGARDEMEVAALVEAAVLGSCQFVQLEARHQPQWINQGVHWNVKPPKKD